MTVILYKHSDNILLEMMTFVNRDLFSALMVFMLQDELGQNLLPYHFKKKG